MITKLLGENISFDMQIDPQAIMSTIVLFVVIFALIMLRMLVFLWRSRPVEMLRSDKVGEKPPKGNWFFALAGIVLLGGAYYLAVSIEDPITALVWFFCCGDHGNCSDLPSIYCRICYFWKNAAEK